MAKVWKHHGGGIKSKVRQRDGERIYYVQVWHEGKRRCEKAGTDIKKARKHLLRIQAEVDNGTFLPSGYRKRLERMKESERLTFAKFTAEYIEDRRHEWKLPAGVPADVIPVYHSSMTRALCKALGSVFLDELTPARIRATFKPWRGTDFHNRALRYLKTMLKYAVQEGHIGDNPAGKVRPGRQPKTEEKRPLDADQRARLIAAMPAGLRPVTRFAFQTGLRWGEIAVLKWDRVDLANRVVHVVQGKTAARKVPLSLRAVQVLECMEHRGETVFTYRSGPIITYTRKAYRSDKHSRPWRTACAAAGLEPSTPHITRHTFATEYMGHGGNLFELAKVGGWTDYKMLERTYGHLAKGWEERVLGPMERMA